LHDLHPISRPGVCSHSIPSTNGIDEAYFLCVSGNLDRAFLPNSFTRTTSGERYMHGTIAESRRIRLILLWVSISHIWSYFQAGKNGGK